jgi:hypothetical protein
MTVKELIRRLRTFPLDAEVGLQDHDAGENELSAHVRDVKPFDPALCRMRHATAEESRKWARGVRVVIVVA